MRVLRSAYDTMIFVRFTASNTVQVFARLQVCVCILHLHNMNAVVGRAQT